jgi:hypothetical protein
VNRTLTSKDDTVPTKVVLQMYSKLGLAPYSITPPPSFTRAPTMVLGVDMLTVNEKTRCVCWIAVSC